MTAHYTLIETQAQIEDIVQESTAVLMYFTTLACSVAGAMEDKIPSSAANGFPGIRLCMIDIQNSPEIAASYQVFVEPTVLIFLQGKETIRKSRSFSLVALEKELQRYYTLIFE
jgi:thioredoxin-like negative regulator of GroEL